MAASNPLLATIIVLFIYAHLAAVSFTHQATATATAAEKFTKLHFYVHDFVHGQNQSVYNVMESSITNQSSSWFGRAQVADHLITSGPDVRSPRLGRIQGIHVMADLEVAALEAIWNVVLDEGSTITVVGRLVALGKEGELSIVGGTGEYAMARGIAMKRTITMDSVTLNSVMEYTLYVSSMSSVELRAT